MSQFTIEELSLLSTSVITEWMNENSELEKTEEHKKSNKPIYTNYDLFGQGEYHEITGEKRDKYLDHDIKNKKENIQKLEDLMQKIFDESEKLLELME